MTVSRRPRLFAIAVATAVVAMCAYLLLERDQALGFSHPVLSICFDYRSAGAHFLPEECWWYSGEDLHTVLGSLGPDKRSLYSLSLLTADVLFPIAYGCLVALLLAWVNTRPLARLELSVPLLAAASDLCENALTALSSSYYDAARTTFVEQVASWASLSKWVLLTTALALLLFRFVRARLGYS